MLKGLSILLAGRSGLNLFKTCQNSERDARKASIALHGLPANFQELLLVLFPIKISQWSRGINMN